MPGRPPAAFLQPAHSTFTPQQALRITVLLSLAEIAFVRRIAAGGGHAEAAAAIAEALADALLDELPEVRRAAAAGLQQLLAAEAAARRQPPPPHPWSPAAEDGAGAGTGAGVGEDTAAAAAAAQLARVRRALAVPVLLAEGGVAALAAAAGDTDGPTRRRVMAALGCVRPARPGQLREVVQVRWCRCVLHRHLTYNCCGLIGVKMT